MVRGQGYVRDGVYGEERRWEGEGDWGVVQYPGDRTYGHGGVDCVEDVGCLIGKAWYEGIVERCGMKGEGGLESLQPQRAREGRYVTVCIQTHTFPIFAPSSKPRPPLRAPINRIPNVTTHTHPHHHKSLQEKPHPPSALPPLLRIIALPLILLLLPSLIIPTNIVLPRLCDMHVMRRHLDDIVVIVQFSCFRRKAEVGDAGELDGADGEALRPLISGFVLKFDLEGLFLIVGQADFGGDRGATETSCL